MAGYHKHKKPRFITKAGKIAFYAEIAILVASKPGVHRKEVFETIRGREYSSGQHTFSFGQAVSYGLITYDKQVKGYVEGDNYWNLLNVIRNAAYNRYLKGASL